MKRTFVLFFALAGAACREDVQLLPPMSIDASGIDATDGGGEGGTPMCRGLNDPCDVDRPCCANRCTSDGVCKGACLPDGMSCTDSQQCCGLDCSTRHTCEPPALCTSLGRNCSVDRDCCCGVCSGTCVAGYRSIGQACAYDWQCTMGNCTGGFCQMNLTCRGLGFACTQNHDCCLGYCFMNHCESVSCTPSG